MFCGGDGDGDGEALVEATREALGEAVRSKALSEATLTFVLGLGPLVDASWCKATLGEAAREALCDEAALEALVEASCEALGEAAALVLGPLIEALKVEALAVGATPRGVCRNAGGLRSRSDVNRTLLLIRTPSHRAGMDMYMSLINLLTSSGVPKKNQSDIILSRV